MGTIQNFKGWLPVIALALSIFSVVTMEMMPIGLLTMMAESFATPVGKGGLIIALPALVASVTAPLVLLCGAQFNRKWLLVGLMSLLVISNGLSAWASSMAIFLFSRILLGICMGGIWTVAGGLGGRLVKVEQVALATSLIFSGVAIASVVGVPLGVFLGDLWNWRIAFMVMAVFVALLVLLLIISLPSLPNKTKIAPSSFIQLFANRTVVMGLLITLFLVSGHFMAYTYIRPLLSNDVGFADRYISVLLLTYGVIGIVGNFFFGVLAGKRIRLAIGIMITLLLFALVIFNVFAINYSVAIVLLCIWGFAYGGVSVSMMTWMMRVSLHQTESATALYIAVFNLAIAGGASLGGGVYDALGLSYTFTLASGLVVLAFIGLVMASVGLRSLD